MSNPHEIGLHGVSVIEATTANVGAVPRILMANKMAIMTLGLFEHLTHPRFANDAIGVE